MNRFVTCVKIPVIELGNCELGCGCTSEVLFIFRNDNNDLCFAIVYDCSDSDDVDSELLTEVIVEEKETTLDLLDTLNFTKEFSTGCPCLMMVTDEAEKTVRELLQ